MQQSTNQLINQSINQIISYIGTLLRHLGTVYFIFFNLAANVLIIYYKILPFDWE